MKSNFIIFYLEHYFKKKYFGELPLGPANPLAPGCSPVSPPLNPLLRKPLNWIKTVELFETYSLQASVDRGQVLKQVGFLI